MSIGRAYRAQVEQLVRREHYVVQLKAMPYGHTHIAKAIPIIASVGDSGANLYKYELAVKLGALKKN
jgi:hypothetical protein